MDRTQRIGILVLAFFFTFLSAAETFAGVRSAPRRVDQRRSVADHVVAYAALNALNGGTGWGRFVVRDDLLPSGDERTVRVSLFGLEANAEYVVEADGVEVGTIVTDRRGDGALKLKTRGRNSGDVPSDLPLASEIAGASVFDTWRTTVLEGVFTVVREHINDPTVHKEKINLEDATGGDARGMAAVRRKESGAQGFGTMAAGLEPGLTYKIVVDTIEVGIVTADEEGQAGLELHVPDDENPLPEELQPVDNIREVQWFQGELLLLSGVFTGESDTDGRCHELRGTFVKLTDNGFVMMKGEHEAEIFVTADTKLEGFDDLTDLVEGDRLEVEACWNGEELVAESVELKEPERECMEFRGAFVGLTDSGFLLQKGDEQIAIVVTDDTELEGFGDLAELVEGDWLEVEACLVGDDMVAESVEFKERQRDCWEFHGTFVMLTDSGFLLRKGDDDIAIVVTDETELEGFSDLTELVEGDWLEVEACRSGDDLVAESVELKKRGNGA